MLKKQLALNKGGWINYCIYVHECVKYFLKLHFLLFQSSVVNDILYVMHEGKFIFFSIPQKRDMVVD